MSTAKLVKWGNSVGVRIPAQDLKTINAYLGEEFEIIVNSEGGFTLTPIKDLQQGWLEAFNLMAEKGQDTLLIGSIDNEFDQDEWKW